MKHPGGGKTRSVTARLQGAGEEIFAVKQAFQSENAIRIDCDLL
jgi:hypothetical protein